MIRSSAAALLAMISLASPARSQTIVPAEYRWRTLADGADGKSEKSVVSITCPPVKMEPPPIAPLMTVGTRFGGLRHLSFTAAPRQRLTQSSAGANDGLADATSVAFCESDPRFIAVVGGWDRGVNGGGGASTDGGVTWTGFAGKGLDHPGFKDHPSLGRVAVGATQQPNGFPIIVWVPRAAVPRYSLDWGRTWAEGNGAPKGTSPGEWEPWQTLAADPVEGRTFYLFSNNLDKTGSAQIYKSTDGGGKWSLAGRIRASSKDRTFAAHHLKAMPGASGELWLAIHNPGAPGDEPASGFHRSLDAGATWTRIARLHPIRDFAFGAAAPGRKNPALVVTGTMGKESGIFLSDDATTLTGDLAGATWKKIRDEQAEILGADRHSHGRVFAGSVRAISYGEPLATGSPSPPTNLTVEPGLSEMTVEWTDPIGAESYRVERTQSGQMKRFETAESRIVDSDAAAGAPATYRVIALNQFGESQPSAAVAASRYAKLEPVARFGSPHNNSDSAAHATDGDPRTAFDASAADGAFAGFDAGRAAVVTLLRYWPRDSHGKRMIGGEFQAAASQDGPWTTLHTVTLEPARGQFTEVRLHENSAAFRFHRYVGGKGSHGNIAEMEFYEGGTISSQ